MYIIGSLSATQLKKGHLNLGSIDDFSALFREFLGNECPSSWKDVANDVGNEQGYFCNRKPLSRTGCARDALK